MMLDNSPADRKTYAITSISTGSMQPLEDLKDPVRILRIEADSVVADGKEPIRRAALRRDFDFRRDIGLPKLDGISEQVLHHLSHLHLVYLDQR
jgi:hypothetical protein